MQRINRIESIIPVFLHGLLFLTTLNFLSTPSRFFQLFMLITAFLAASLVPLIGLLFLITLPLVIYILCMVNELGRTLIALLSGLCTILIFLSLMQGSVLPLFALMTMGMAGILMAWSTGKKLSIEIIVLLPSFLILGVIALYFFFGGIQLSMSPWQLVEKNISEAIDMNINLYTRLPLNPDEIKGIRDNKPEILELFTRIFPALCVIASLLTVWMNILLANKLLQKSGLGLSALAEWKAPAILVWIFLAGAGLSFIPQIHLSSFGINVVLAASFVYLLQGLAIVSFFFQKRNISIFFRWLFYFLIAIQQILMIAIAAVGFFDLWIDFRKFFRKDQTTD